MTPAIRPHDPSAAPSVQSADAAARQRLNAFLQRVSDAARPQAARIRRLLLLHLLSACWITYFTHLFFAASIWFPIVLLIVLCLPAVMLVLLYMALASVVDLPERINSMGDSIRTVSGRFLEKHRKKTGPADPVSGKKTPGLFKLGAMIADIREVLFEVPGAFDLWGSIAMLASPFFLMLAGIAIAISAGLVLTAFFILLIHIL